MTDLECYACAQSASAIQPPRERILRTGSWRVAHAIGTSLLGWLVVVPTTHITSLSELTPTAAAELGPLLRDLTQALIDVTGCVKTYVLLLAEQEGFAHLHFHVVPRSADQAPELRGTGIFALLGVDAADEVPAHVRDDIAERIASRLPTR